MTLGLRVWHQGVSYRVGEEGYSCENAKQFLLVLLFIHYFSIQITVTLRLPHPVFHTLFLLLLTRRNIYCLALFVLSQESQEKRQLLEREFKSQNWSLSFLPLHTMNLIVLLNLRVCNC